MKAVVVMFDSLNRHLLSPYGCEWTHTPNFKRLAEHGDGKHVMRPRNSMNGWV